MEHNLLTISSQQEHSEEREENGYVIRERRSGAFRRSFALPEEVDADQISATFKNGLLTLTVPKTGKTQARHDRGEERRLNGTTSTYWCAFQERLFPTIEQDLGPLGERYQSFIIALGDCCRSRHIRPRAARKVGHGLMS